MKFTPAQQQAIDLNQHNILVNAAAGSGKTAVLVERLFKRLIEGETLDAFIVITFTKLAASEMKERLSKRIEEKIATLSKDNPLYTHLIYVESQISTSQISTIDAFCSFIVREYGYVLPEITTTLSLIDGVDTQRLNEETFLELAEVILATDAYRALAEQYIDIQDISNQKLLKMLLTIVPEFAQVADHQKRYQELLFFSKPLQSVEQLSLFQRFIERQAYVLSDITLDELDMHAYSERYEKDIENIKEYIAIVKNAMNPKNAYVDIHTRLSQLKFPRKPVVPKDQQDDRSEVYYKQVRENIKKELDRIVENFQSSSEKEVEIINAGRSQMQILIDMAYAFYTRAQKKRLEVGRVQFSDISQLAYKILTLPHIQEKWRSKISEIMIDEYQDTTRAQEELFASFGDDKLFLVGDMKQAIYRFRQSDPLLFAEKNQGYRQANEHTVVDLNQNFRSRQSVLTYINDLFEPLMDTHVGEMEYDDNAKLYFGLDTYPGADEKVELHLIDKDDPDIRDENKAQAQVIVNQIQQLMQEDRKVFERGETRILRFSDIAILTRNNKSDFLDALVETLQDAHIPFQKDGKTKFHAHLEVHWILALLQALSNPFDDIQFATVLKSPFGKCSVQQLYQISKIEADEKTLYQKARLSSDQAVITFFERFDTIQGQLFSLSPTDIFRKMIQTFQFEQAIAMLPNIYLRKQNIEILYELTKTIEMNRTVSFSQYVQYLVEQVMSDHISINTPELSATPDAITIQTFHKSKGLEYPIVFVANLNKNFNLQIDDSMFKLKDAGIVSAFQATEEYGRYRTIESILCKDQLRHEALSEEMRLLYVAVTRAREKLYMIGVTSEVEKSLPLQKRYPYGLRIRAKSMLDWVLLSLSKTAKQIELHMYKQPDIQGVKTASKTEHLIQNKQLSQSAYQSLNWEDKMYAYRFVPLKLSVTELKKKSQSIEQDGMYRFESNEIIQPTLKSQKVSRAEIGTATHTLFEHYDFSRIKKDEIIQQINWLVAKNQIQETVASYIDVEKIATFFESDVGKLLCQQQDHIQREVPFRMMIDASRAGYDASAEILIQGVIDALIVDEKNKNVRIFDYKTDDMSRYTTREKKKQQIAKRYTIQADLYKEAISRIYEGYEVSMYFITLDDSVMYTYQNGIFK